MKVEIVSHNSGDQLPILLDSVGLPIVIPNEFILSRRSLGLNTLIRNARELIVIYKWLSEKNYDFMAKLVSSHSFTEAELRGGLVEALRVNQIKGKSKTVKPDTFNQRLTTTRQFFGWCLDVQLSLMPMASQAYEALIERKAFILRILDSGFMSAPPLEKKIRKGLRDEEVDFLIQVLDPESELCFGRDSSVKVRNFVSVGLMLFCGLRPGEVLSLRVEDIQLGAISAVNVQRRPPDPSDKRRPRPQIKRNGRLIPIEYSKFALALNEYIVNSRDELERKSSQESEYLILSDDGAPLSQSSITQFFQILRLRYSNKLPENLTAKSLRHTFSARLERVLRKSGMEEQRRREALAVLRGDSNLDSQDTYIAQEVEEAAMKMLKRYQSEILSRK